MSVPAPWLNTATWVPESNGFVRASFGQRAGALLIEGVLLNLLGTVPIYFGFFAAVATGRAAVFIIAKLVTLGYVVFELYSIFRKGGNIGHRIMGVQYVREEDGSISGWRIIGKSLFQSLLSAFSGGLVPLLISYFTFRSPENRTWFDKQAKLYGVDTKSGRSAAQTPVTAPVPALATDSGSSVWPPAVAPVPQVAPVAETPAITANSWAPNNAFWPGLDDSGWQHQSPQPTPAQNFSTPSGAAANATVYAGFTPASPAPTLPPTPFTPMSAPVQPGPAQPTPTGVGSTPYSSPVQPVAAPGGDVFISHTPFGGGQPSAEPVPAPDLAPRPVVREMRSVAAEEVSNATIMDPDAFNRPSRAVSVVLDGGHRYTIDSVAVLGRNPMPPAEFGQAQRIVVDDPAMMLSKTHCAIGLTEDGSVWVQDLHSTNGSKIVTSTGSSELLTPGARTPLPAGGRLEFGKHSVRIDQ